MHSKILEKCLVELQKPEPKLDYVRGMLETLIDLDSKDVTTPIINPTYGQTTSTADSTAGIETIPPGFANFVASSITND